LVTGGPKDSIWSRPETAATGRPAERSRAEFTAAAISLADSHGLEAVTMRRIAAEVGTGAASLYRYVKTREELLDLMVDEVAVEYDLSPSGRDWLAGIVDVARQTLAIMRRHPWLASLMTLRPMVGPHALDLVEHVLETLDGHPAPGAAKLQAFAILNGIIAMVVQNELALRHEADGLTLSERQAGLNDYLRRIAEQGRHPRLAAAMAEQPLSDAAPVKASDDPFDAIIAGVVIGLLGPTG
jgi:AcrR family transcriptional regulator